MKLSTTIHPQPSEDSNPRLECHAEPGLPRAGRGEVRHVEYQQTAVILRQAQEDTAILPERTNSDRSQKAQQLVEFASFVVPKKVIL